MNKITIGVIVGIVALAGWYVVSDKSDKAAVGGGDSGSGQLELVSENNFDFGEILMTGGDVKVNYTLKNTGDNPVKIINAETSCACTVAKIFNSQGEGFGPFGMQGGAHAKNPKISMEIPAGGEVTVEATYNPLAHGPSATGALVREVYINTDKKEKITLKFRGKGVKEFSNVKGPSLAFTNKEYDFGVTKQSVGMYETKFEVVNNGSETVLIDSMPASCQCVTAEIDKKQIPVGAKAVITVKLDANLHPEPKGRFYKTIEIISNIKPSQELKVFANMDYDLGMDKLKLAVHDDGDKHDKKSDTSEQTGDQKAEFKNITSVQLEAMLGDKDFTMIDVHTPEQEHIPGTDYMISYDQTEKIIAQLSNKDARVVLYCRSGGMSKVTAKALVDKGYTNVYNLENGANEWKAGGREVLPKGSVEQK